MQTAKQQMFVLNSPYELFQFLTLMRYTHTAASAL